MPRSARVATDILAEAAVRARAIAAAASAWRDTTSEVRTKARRALADSIWPASIVEAALDNALWDLDEARALELVRPRPLVERNRVLVVLPGNIIGPAIQSAFCAAVAGARATLKSAGGERHLAALVAEQFDASGSPLSGSVTARYWRGGEIEPEASALGSVDRVIAFGDDATIENIRTRAASYDVDVKAYGESYSIGYVADESDAVEAAQLAAADICLFDQRGCMSPQTIYIAGDRGRAVLFSRTLARAIAGTSTLLPRAKLEYGEAALVADAIRRLSASALEPTPHGLDTVITGPLTQGVPEFAVAVEAFGQPTCIGFGRIAVVKPCPGARDVATQLRYYGRTIETIGLSESTTDADRSALRLAGSARMCSLGDMQRPPFAYRPTVGDFCAS